MADITACHTRQSDEWATPDDLFARLADAYGPFDLDAAATSGNRKVARWFGSGSPERHDALLAPWGAREAPARVWLNPPYSRLHPFLTKAATEARAGRALVVCLIPARTDTRAFHDFVWDTTAGRPRPGVAVRFLRGRVKFGGPTKSGKPEAAPFPSMIVVFRAEEVGGSHAEDQAAAAPS